MVPLFKDMVHMWTSLTSYINCMCLCAY